MSKYATILKRHGCSIPEHQQSQVQPTSGAATPRLASLDLSFSSVLVLAESGQYVSPTRCTDHTAERHTTTEEVAVNPVPGASEEYCSNAYSMGKGGFTVGAVTVVPRSTEGIMALSAAPEAAPPRQLDFNRNRMRARLLRNKQNAQQ
mmetsp:Transcript_29184/g.82312  ORF Transcript_29184/g.82312 Transcript_29184/m.82312 type:complete len:148 (+) Transcript_29184:279-722(+)